MDKVKPFQQISNTEYCPWRKEDRIMDQMETAKKVDLRVIKTKKAIRLAFTELMSRKPLEEITVSDVAAEAMINRKTFYAHYASIFDIIAEIEDEVVASFQQMLAKKHFEDILQHPNDLFRDLNQIINNDIDLYGRLLTVSGTSNLVHKIIQMIRKQVCSAYQDEGPVDPQVLDMVVHFILSGLLAVFTEWYNSGQTQSIDKMSEQLSMLCIEGINGIIRADQSGSIS